MAHEGGLDPRELRPADVPLLLPASMMLPPLSVKLRTCDGHTSPLFIIKGKKRFVNRKNQAKWVEIRRGLCYDTENDKRKKGKRIMTERLFITKMRTCGRSRPAWPPARRANTASTSCLTGHAFTEGGGQAGDTGLLGGVRVTDTHERDGEVVHYCGSPLEVGAEVAGEIDWDARFERMQLHSGEHIFKRPGPQALRL